MPEGPLQFSLPFEVDADIVRAIAWCRVRVPKERPHDENAYYRAEKLGLLAHDPIWRATPQGEGVLIALGLLEPTWVVDRMQARVLWARQASVNMPAQFVQAWSESYADMCSDYEKERTEAEARWRDWPGEPGQLWLFFTTTEELPRP